MRIRPTVLKLPLVVRSVVVGTDGSPSAQAAVEEALDLARSEGARVHFVTAYPDPARLREHLATTGRDDPVDLRTVAENILLRAGRDAEEAGVQYETYDREDDPTEAILAVADEQAADLIVLGDRGLRGVSRFLLGSVSSKVSHHAKCSVMVVRKS
jgi:nucleotide-binding universal stress UspA family protein